MKSYRSTPCRRTSCVLLGALGAAAIGGCGAETPGGDHPGATTGGTGTTQGVPPVGSTGVATTGTTSASGSMGAGGSSAVTTTGTGGSAPGGAGGSTGDPLPDSGSYPDGPSSDGASASDGASVGRGDSSIVVTDPGTDGDGNVMIASPFRTAPEYTVAAGVKRGQTINFTIDGMTSIIYKAAYTRKCAVYIPADYVSGTEIPFMVAQDGLQFGYLADVVPVLDNYIAQRKLPAMAVIAADPSTAARRSSEYDTVSDTFVRFVETELLPAAKAQAKAKNIDLNLTNDPEGRSSYGGSSGGSCAFVMGWFGNFNRILTISGSFRPLQTSAMYPMGAAEFQTNLIPNTPAKPLRVFLEAGSNDLGGWKNANDQMAAALAAKKYHYRYVFAQGAGHTDGGAIHQYMPETLLWLWRGYPIKM